MEGNSKLLYVESEIQKALSSKFYFRAFRDRAIARAFKILIVLLGSAVTVILGVSESGTGKIVALILSGVITIVNSVDALFNYQAKATNLIDYYAKLDSLILEIQYYRAGRSSADITVEKADEFFEKLLQAHSDFYNNRSETIKSSFIAGNDVQSNNKLGEHRTPQ